MILCSNPHAQYLARRAEIDAAIARVLAKGWYILGEEVKAFEAEFAAWCGAAHGIGVGSGTEALHLAIRACGIGPGDEVITVAHTAVATVAAIEAAGATPVFVDIEPDCFTMDPALIEQRITKRTRAIIPVHIYGQPADLGAILPIARRHGLRVIEDCAQAHGAETADYGLQTTDDGRGGEAATAAQSAVVSSGIRCPASVVCSPLSVDSCPHLPRRVGSIGDLGCFSFYPTKNLGALGDGGAIVTSDPALAERCRLLREYGWAERYVSHIAGFNSRLDELQAAVLRVKLPHLDADNAKRARIAAQYAAGLAGTGLVLPGVRRVISGQLSVISHRSSVISGQRADAGGRGSATVPTDHRSPITDHSRPHVYHLYVVRSARRDELQAYLKARGIGALIHYPVPVHLQPAYRGRLPGGESLPETERAAREVVSLPMFPELSDADVRAVIEAVREFGAR